MHIIFFPLLGYKSKNQKNRKPWKTKQKKTFDFEKKLGFLHPWLTSVYKIYLFNFLKCHLFIASA